MIILAVSIFFQIINFIGELFKTWLHTLFLVPFENYDMLWLLIPIWLAWFFAEFFQEKIGTSMGNAITNAVVILWGSIDCVRQTVNFIVKKTITSPIEIIARFSLIILLFFYGFLIIHYGIKGNPIIKKIGRVRNITYVFAMFVPIFYNAIPFSLNHIISAILFFPLFYYIIEGIDKIVPNPKAIEEDLKNDEKIHLNNDINNLNFLKSNHTKTLNKNSNQLNNMSSNINYFNNQNINNSKYIDTSRNIDNNPYTKNQNNHINSKIKFN